MSNSKEIIAQRVAQELTPGSVVNLGIGLPTQVSRYVPAEKQITFQSENGLLGLAPCQQPNADLVDAGGMPCGMAPGAMIFDSAFSFALIRGGHIDICVLRGLQVDEKANLANWMVPGKRVPGMGGAMDLVTGAKRVIIAMEHTAKNGDAKIIPQCSYPLTALNVVDLIVTQLAVFAFINGQLTLTEIQQESSLEEIQQKTSARFELADTLRRF